MRPDPAEIENKIHAEVASEIKHTPGQNNAGNWVDGRRSTLYNWVREHEWFNCGSWAGYLLEYHNEEVASRPAKRTKPLLQDITRMKPRELLDYVVRLANATPDRAKSQTKPEYLALVKAAKTQAEANGAYDPKELARTHPFTAPAIARYLHEYHYLLGEPAGPGPKRKITGADYDRPLVKRYRPLSIALANRLVPMDAPAWVREAARDAALDGLAHAAATVKPGSTDTEQAYVSTVIQNRVRDTLDSVSHQIPTDGDPESFKDKPPKAGIHHDDTIDRLEALQAVEHLQYLHQKHNLPGEAVLAFMLKHHDLADRQIGVLLGLSRDQIRNLIRQTQEKIAEHPPAKKGY